jgi:hypothetical protein
MSKALKSSASSRPAALKSTSGSATKVERIVRVKSDPAAEKRLKKAQLQGLAELQKAVEGNLKSEGLPPPRRSRRRWLRPKVYPPVEVDAEVIEWFMKRTGDSSSMSFAINYALMDFIHEQMKAQKARKKAG